MDTESTLDVLFIYPSYGDGDSESRLLPARVEDDIPNQESPNIGVGYLLAKAKQYGIRAKFMDMVFDNVSADALIDYVKTHRPNLVGFTAFTVHIKAAGYLAERIKLAVPDTVVSIGGVHASAIPLETLDEFPAFDFAYCGEAEDTLADIVEYATNPTRLAKVPGVVMRGQTTFQPNWTQDISTLPFPAWEEFELSRYGGNWPHFSERELPILAQRGCPYQCNFCMRASGRTVRMRPPESVIAEIERNIEEFGCTAIGFLDETFGINKKWAREFFHQMKKRGLNKKTPWGCSTRVSHTTQELLEAMSEAGCYAAFFGLESADTEVLITTGKKITTDDMKRTIGWAKGAGIIPYGAFIIGLPGDTEETVHKAIDLAGELNLYSITFPIAVPFPGTELYTIGRSGQHGMEILSYDWDRYGKQEGGVLESKDIPSERRKELQDIAYASHPKKKLDTYVRDYVNVSAAAAA